MRLRVEEAKENNDIGKNIVRIDPKLMKDIGVIEGNALLLVGKKTSCAKVLPAHSKDIGLNIIRIDRFIRKNCDVSINDEIEVGKTEINEAERITLAPIDVKISVDDDFIRFVKDRLIGWYVTIGDLIVVKMLTHIVPFQVIETLPEGTVELSGRVKMKIFSQPIQNYKQDCIFQKHISSDDIRCGLMIKDFSSKKLEPKNYEECLIYNCPIFQTWKLLNDK